MPVGPGRLPGQLLSAYAPVSPLRGVPAPAAEQGSPHDLAVAHAKYFDSATDNLESPNTVYAATLGSESGQITPGNSMTWETTEPQLAQFTFAKGDVITGITRDHGQAVRGHTLVRHSELPGWIGSLPPAHVQAAMTHHITEVAGHYKSEVAAWDIAHEPLSDDGPSVQARSTTHGAAATSPPRCEPRTLPLRAPGSPSTAATPRVRAPRATPCTTW